MDSQPTPQQQPYDSRWFIWTIVFLVATGISLVSYILLSDNGDQDAQMITPSKLLHKKSAELPAAQGTSTTPQAQQ